MASASFWIFLASFTCATDGKANATAAEYATAKSAVRRWIFIGLLQSEREPLGWKIFRPDLGGWQILSQGIYHAKSRPKHASAGIDRLIRQICFDPEELVVFGEPVRPRQRTGLDL